MAAALVAVAILLVPPLVRANAHFRRPNDGPITFRLNRGFDLPVTKLSVTPPAGSSLALACAARTIAAIESRRVTVDLDQSCRDQHRQSPDPLRGPPATLTF
jgi:hypothetical protein